MDSGGPKEAQVQSYSPGGASVPTCEGTLVPPGEYELTACLWQQCGLMSIYFCHLLWSPYVIGQTIIFLPCDFHLLSFFPCLISVVGDWMSTILPHMVKGKKRKEEYLYSAFLHQGTHKALRHGSHSFTCKQHHACLSLVAFTRCHHHSN